MESRQLYPCLIVASLLLAACSGRPGAGKGAEENQAEPATPVRVEAVRKGMLHQTVTAEAILYPVRQASIMPKISAPVARFLVERGTHVQQGQLVALLEDRDLVAVAEESRNQYRQAQASYETTTAATMPEDLKKAATDLQTAQATLDAAKRVYHSRQRLLEQGAIAQKLVDDAHVALVQAQSQLDVAQQHLNALQTVGRPEQLKSAGAQLDAAKAHLANADAQVSYAEVRSPIAGIVSDRPLNIGEMANGSTAILSIVDISEIVARASVPVDRATDMKVGNIATISAAGAEITGKVAVVSPAVDPNTTTVEIWVRARNVEERLKPGVTAQITVQVRDIPGAVIVPSTALLTSDEGGEKVMIAGSDSLAHEQPIKIGIRDGDSVQVLDGLKPGDQVITQGGVGLDDKAKIKLEKPEEGAAGSPGK